jgi:rod shape-determining protein MreB
LLAKLDDVLRRASGLAVSIAEDPLTFVALGTGRALDEMKALHGVLLNIC